MGITKMRIKCDNMGFVFAMMPELLALAQRLDDVQLNENTRDTIKWWPESSGAYTAKSAYLLQFEGIILTDFYPNIWKCWAPGKCKFFLWTAVHERILTADALLRRGWENNYFCPLCMRSLETPMHLLIECPWTRHIWSTLANWSKL
jgi:hypothetical protein